MNRKTSKQKPAYLDPTLSAEARAADLLSRMTLEEKIRQMLMNPFYKFLKKDKTVSMAAVRKFFRGDSIGCLQDVRAEPKQCVSAVNEVQRYLVEHTRLGIPAMVAGECLHGCTTPKATIFPQAIALGSTWEPELIRRMAEAAAKEARAVGFAQALAPDLDLGRDPRWGRFEETYGEDPYLVSRMGVAYIKGMQGDGPTIDRQHLVCTAKHFAAHGSPEAGLNLAPVAGGMRDLRTTYLPPFHAAVKEAGVLAIMPAYSQYDDIPVHKSKLFLTRILREEWGFTGFVFSDYCGIRQLFWMHKTAHSFAEAGRQALAAGVDLEADTEYGYGAPLLDLVRKGEVPVEWIDRAAGRVLRVKFLAGLFENPYADVRAVSRVMNCAEHRALALDIARESIVLLKNEKNLLPLDPSIRSVAVIGPNADLYQFGSGAFLKTGAATPLQAIRRMVSRRTQVRYAPGCGMSTLSRDGFEKAVRLARESEVAIVAIGETSHSAGGPGWAEYEKDNPPLGGEGVDRSELTPPGVQEELVKAIHATGTPTVVVLAHGRSYGIPWIAENVAAIVETWYAGEQGSNALAEILFGKVNPSGKLPVNMPRSVGHLPAFYNHRPSARGMYHQPGTPEKPGHDYVFSSATPLFPFGHGLSYTKFEYRNLRVSPRKIATAGRVEVSVEVANAGKRAGKEVVQLFLNDVVSSVTTPVKTLRRFQKIALRPGQKKTVRFALGPDDLALYDETMARVVEPGDFEVMIGGLKKTVTVTRQT